MSNAQLILEDGTVYEGQSFGASTNCDGEVVFNTGMVGYPESLTDPSYRGQILTFTYPLIGNYGVPSEELNAYGFSDNLESEAIHVRGVVVSWESRDYSHHKAVSSLHNWMEHHGIPGISGVDTRALTKKLREKGVMLGRIVSGVGLQTHASEGQEAHGTIPDPNLSNLVAEVSCQEVEVYGEGSGPTILAYDCGMKRGIIRSFLERGVRVIRVPWDFDLEKSPEPFDAVFISNGPGDPKQCTATIENIQKAIDADIPTFGICLGTQLMALAIGGDTYKLPYGHRGANQPCIEERSAISDQRSASEAPSPCIITSQNHGFAVSDKLPRDWEVWFRNANDNTVEGIRHSSGKFFAVQFHPESRPGPEDANYLFDAFLSVVEESRVAVSV